MGDQAAPQSGGLKLKSVGTASPGKGLGLKPPHSAHHHDHGHHDHSKCSHEHDHGERATTMRPCPQQVPPHQVVQLDLDALLPGETDDAGRFAKLAENLMRIVGVRQVHVRTDGSHPEVCVHHDENVVRAPQLLPEVRHRARHVADRYRTQTWFVSGMQTAQCGYVIEHVLHRTPGILSADVAYGAERLIVEYDSELVTAAAIVRQIHHVGYELDEPVAGHVCALHDHGGGLGPKLEVPLVVVSGVLLGLGMLLDVGNLVAVPIQNVVYSLALLSGGALAGRASLNQLRAGKVDIEVLTVLAAFGAAAMGAWFEGAFLLFLFSLGHMLEHRALDKARRAVEALGKLRPDTAQVERNGHVTAVPIANVAIGEIFVVRPGDRVALDGVVVSGQSHLDQAAITGESLPVPKSAGDSLFAGTVNADGALRVRVTKGQGESTLAKLIDLVAQAEARKGRAQKLTKRLESIFVPVVLAGTPLLVLVLWWMGTPLDAAILRGLSLLVAASPCALAVATPAVVLSAVARAAKSGVLIKGGVHLETLAGLRAVAFDKTGTLTVGRPAVQAVWACDGSNGDVLLQLAAAAETQSSHPLAAAVVAAAQARGLPQLPADNGQATHGKGLAATVQGQTIRVGSVAFFADLPQAVLAQVQAEQELGRTTMVVAQDEAVLGVISLADTPRPEAPGALAQLRAMGLDQTVMLSGDAAPVAQAVASQLGVARALAPLLPEQKVSALREMMRATAGKVAMVGDGVNDAPALATAHLGVAMGAAGSDVALETADVVLMGDDLRKLPFAIALGRAAQRAIRVNITVALGIACVLVVAAILGWVRVSQAVVLHEGSTVFVVANGLRLLWFSGGRSESKPG